MQWLGPGVLLLCWAEQATETPPAGPTLAPALAFPSSSGHVFQNALILLFELFYVLLQSFESARWCPPKAFKFGFFFPVAKVRPLVLALKITFVKSYALPSTAPW